MKRIKAYKKCPHCGRLYEEPNVFYCYSDNYPLVDYETDNPIGEQLKNFNRPTAKPILDVGVETDPNHIPRCPTCGSENLVRISGTRRAAGFLLFGIFSKTAHAQFECSNCGYKW